VLVVHDNSDPLFPHPNSASHHCHHHAFSWYENYHQYLRYDSPELEILLWLQDGQLRYLKRFVSCHSWWCSCATQFGMNQRIMSECWLPPILSSIRLQVCVIIFPTKHCLHNSNEMIWTEYYYSLMMHINATDQFVLFHWTSQLEVW
jgi:hypothetical protein